MKRLPAILFLLILVFNFYGYQVVISLMEKGSELSIEQTLDKSAYSDSELFSIKTALHLPYYTSSPQYERVYGTVTVNGIVYEYVKKRVYRDTLELLCLPNKAKTKLREVHNELASSSAEGQASVPVKKGTSTVKISLPDYFQVQQTADAFSLLIKRNYSLQNVSINTFPFQKRQERPPQVHPDFS